MERLDPELLKFWGETSWAYHNQMEKGGGCHSYLSGRGLSEQSMGCYRLGYVRDPYLGHESMRGRLVIPVLKKLECVGLKFRCIEDHSCKDFGHAKYLTDGSQWLINTSAIDKPGDILAICEGEIDSYILDGECGIPAVGVPGVDAWSGHPWWVDLLRGHKKVLMFADNDSANPKNPGMRLAQKVLADIPRARLVTLPENMDVNETFLKYGKAEIYRRAGLDQQYLELVA